MKIINDNILYFVVKINGTENPIPIVQPQTTFSY